MQYSFSTYVPNLLIVRLLTTYLSPYSINDDVLAEDREHAAQNHNSGDRDAHHSGSSAPANEAPDLSSEDIQPTKRRREVAAKDRKRTKVRSCRRCGQSTCPGSSKITRCPITCTSPCILCGNLDDKCPGGVNHGRKCSVHNKNISYPRSTGS